ncbi:MAG: TIM barrel protein [Planctomycetota bacterium]
MRELFEHAMELGFRCFETGVSRLGFNLGEVLEAKKELGIEITSVHNVISEKPIDPKNLRGDFVSSPDETTRAAGVACLLDTISNCNKMGGRAVVIHSGYIKDIKFQEMLENSEALGNRILSNGIDAEARRKIDEIRRWRAQRAAPYLESSIKSLDEVAASERELLLGIESRYFYNEIPDIGELATMFERLTGGNFGYWHDVGHAQMGELFGLARHEEWLERYGDRLIGVHLHDMKGMRDHQAIGAGDIDFRMVAKYLKPDTIKVLEFNSSVASDQAADSLKRLEDFNIS